MRVCRLRHQQRRAGIDQQADGHGHQPGPAFALLLNLSVTLVILLLVFRTPVAAFIPLALALAAVISATAILGVISQATALSNIFSEVVLLMGLATGIDYALFVISRFRNERRKGRSKEDALRAAAGTSGKAVIFAGCTVVLAVSGMFLIGDSTFNSLGLAAIVVVVLAVLISVTLLPALLMMLADHIDRFSLPFFAGTGEGGGIWGFITDRVLRRPVVLAAVTCDDPSLVALPFLQLNLGFNGAKGLPDAVEAKKALLVLQDNFTLGLTSPALVVVDAGKDNNIYAAGRAAAGRPASSAPCRAESTASAGPDAAFGAPVQTNINDAGDTEAIRIPLNADTGEQKALDAVQHLRNDLIPAAFSGSSAKALVTGDSAANLDFRDNIIFRTPFVFAFVLGLAFIILLADLPLDRHRRQGDNPQPAFGRARPTGLLVLVFQKGWLLEGVLELQGDGHHRVVAAAVPVHDPVRAIDGLPHVRAQPHQGGARARREQRRGGLDRHQGDGGDDHERGDHHGGGGDDLRLHALHRPEAVRLRAGGRHPHRRDGDPLDPAAGQHEAPGRLQLVSPEVAGVAAQVPDG